MKIARFDPAGGVIQVSVSCDPNRNGSYTIKLWAADENSLVAEYPGNFVNTDDDRHDLDKPNIAHDRRLLELMAVVSIPPGVGPSNVTLRVEQDGEELQWEMQSVPPNSPGKMVDLFIELRRK